MIEHSVVLLEPAGEMRTEDLPFLSMPALAEDRSLGMELTTPDTSYYDARDQLLLIGLEWDLARDRDRLSRQSDRCVHAIATFLR